jgi:hypothetical protein
MNAELETARDDLAFLRGLVTGDDTSTTRGIGEAYVAAGLIYGGQMLLHAAQSLGFLPPTTTVSLAVGLGPTVVFIPVITWISWRNRSRRASNAAGRAIGSVFAAVGLANLFLVAVIGSVAWREHSITTWLIYPCAAFVLQGAAWLVVFTFRRRGWHALVSAGWFATAVAMALTVTSLGYFILFAGLGFLAFMTIPGWVMMRLSRKTV